MYCVSLNWAVRPLEYIWSNFKVKCHWKVSGVTNFSNIQIRVTWWSNHFCHMRFSFTMSVLNDLWPEVSTEANGPGKLLVWCLAIYHLFQGGKFDSFYGFMKTMKVLKIVICLCIIWHYCKCKSFCTLDCRLRSWETILYNEYFYSIFGNLLLLISDYHLDKSQCSAQ